MEFSITKEWWVTSSESILLTPDYLLTEHSFLLRLNVYLFTSYLFICVCACVHLPQNVCGSQRTTNGNGFFPSTYSFWESNLNYCASWQISLSTEQSPQPYSFFTHVCVGTCACASVCLYMRLENSLRHHAQKLCSPWLRQHFPLA